MPVIVIILLVLLGLGVLGSGKPSIEGEKLSAWTYCQELVTKSLKSPGSAEFPWKIDVHTSPGSQTYTVNSYVDARNSFNALIRTRYYCALQGSDANGWTVKSLRIFE